MDDNSTKVVLTALVLAFVVAITRRFDRVSLRIEQLRNQHLRIAEGQYEFAERRDAAAATVQAAQSQP
jgi:hypothetical protein